MLFIVIKEGEYIQIKIELSFCYIIFASCSKAVIFGGVLQPQPSSQLLLLLQPQSFTLLPEVQLPNPRQCVTSVLVFGAKNFHRNSNLSKEIAKRIWIGYTAVSSGMQFQMLVSKRFVITEHSNNENKPNVTFTAIGEP